MSSKIPVTEGFQSVILERHLHHIPARIREPQRIVEAVGIAVVGLQVVLVLYGDVGGELASYDGVLHAAVHVDEVEAVVVLMQGVATVESRGYVVVAEAVGVAPPSPGVVAQPLHGIAADGGRQAALVVF